MRSRVLVACILLLVLFVGQSVFAQQELVSLKIGQTVYGYIGDKEIDTYIFEAEEGQLINLEVFSMSIENPVLVVVDSNRVPVGLHVYHDKYEDSILMKIQEDGMLHVTVLGNGSGYYRLELYQALSDSDAASGYVDKDTTYTAIIGSITNGLSLHVETIDGTPLNATIVVVNNYDEVVDWVDDSTLDHVAMDFGIKPMEIYFLKIIGSQPTEFRLKVESLIIEMGSNA